MKKIFLSAAPVWPAGIALIRILAGIMMIRHGIEIFDANKMNDYTKWMGEIHLSAPEMMSYLGKGIELAGGICLVLGLFTRIMIIPLALTMLFITFRIGEGRILMEDQHPFLFVVIFSFLFLTGPGPFSLDKRLFGKREQLPGQL